MAFRVTSSFMRKERNSLPGRTRGRADIRTHWVRDRKAVVTTPTTCCLAKRTNHPR
jgi:hypothetical protein